jgi:hypothetical protein
MTHVNYDKICRGTIPNGELYYRGFEDGRDDLRDEHAKRIMVLREVCIGTGRHLAADALWTLLSDLGMVAEVTCQCAVGPLNGQGTVERKTINDPFVLCGKKPAKLYPHTPKPVALCEEHKPLAAGTALPRCSKHQGAGHEDDYCPACAALLSGPR